MSLSNLIDQRSLQEHNITQIEDIRFDNSISTRNNIKNLLDFNDDSNNNEWQNVPVIGLREIDNTSNIESSNLLSLNQKHDTIWVSSFGEALSKLLINFGVNIQTDFSKETGRISIKKLSLVHQN